MLLLGACATGSDAMVASIQRAVLPGGGADAVPLDPRFRYLRTTHGRHVGFASLSLFEKTSQGPVEVYSSSSGELLRINSSGRIVGAAGFRTEWRSVSVSAPAWAAIASTAAATPLTRVRDVMPGYRFGVEDDLVVRVIPPPEKTALRGVAAESLTWFEERIVTSAGAKVRRTVMGADSADAWLPPARYAVDLSGDTERVVYAEQCLAADLCLSWQRWSAAMQQPQKTASQKK